jgi:hypothetical protein
LRSNLPQEMKYLYIVDYWVPFPSSEYGGVVSVIAENDNECHDLLLDWRDEYENSHDSRIMERVVNSDKFALAENEESRVVSSFTT